MRLPAPGPAKCCLCSEGEAEPERGRLYRKDWAMPGSAWSWWRHPSHLATSFSPRSCKGCGPCSPSFPPTSIWRERLRSGRWKKIPAEDALGELVKWSLVDFLPSATGEGGRYKLHDLARDFADSRLEAAAREPAQQRHAEHYQEILWKANELFLQGE